jgi:hypothetical protein
MAGIGELVVRGWTDQRTRHLRRVQKVRSRAQRWTVAAAGLSATAAVAVPYAGIGLGDLAWAGVAGTAVAVAVLRWRDARRSAGEPVPAPGLSPLARALTGDAAAVPPALAPAAHAIRAFRNRVPNRSAAADPVRRLDRAVAAVGPLLTRVGGAGAAGIDTGAEAAREATAAESVLRELAYRVVAVERAADVAPPSSRPSLQASRDALADHLGAGVQAYEQLVAAAAECVAAQTAAQADAGGYGLAVLRLAEAADALSGLAAGFRWVTNGGGPSTSTGFA